MPHFLCRTCSVQFAESDAPSARCPIRGDERQDVPAAGQAWTTPGQLRVGHAKAAAVRSGDSARRLDLAGSG